MKTRQRLKWAALVAVPFLIALVMWPVAQRRQERARARAATQKLQLALRAAQGLVPVTVTPPGARGNSGLPRLNPIIVRQLIFEGAALDTHDVLNRTILHDVVWLPLASERERIPLIRFLLTHGADINARDDNGETPLMLAVTWVKPEIVRLLLDKGANIDLLAYQDTSSALNLARANLQVLESVSVGGTPEDKHQVRLSRRIITMLEAAGHTNAGTRLLPQPHPSRP